MKVLGLIFFLFTAEVFAMKEYLAEAKTFGSVSLGNPKSADFSFTEPKGDVSSLVSLNDTSLAGKGAEATEQDIFASGGDKMSIGNFLTHSNVEQINAREEHQINAKSGFYKASIALENNPLGELGGEVLTHRQNVLTKANKTCEEGVSFEVDILRQLVYTPPPRRLIDTEITLYYPEYVKKVGGKNDEIGPLRVGQTNYQINIERFRQYACPHFKPVDAVTGKRYEVDCHRIRNFTLVKVVDFDRDYIVDRYGRTYNPVRLIRISYKHDTYQSDQKGEERWQILNSESEPLIEGNYCFEKKRVCLDKGEKRFEEFKVTRPCWKEKITYQCHSEPREGCAHLKECTLQKSECMSAHKSPCLKWKRTYLCTVSRQEVTRSLSGQRIFCLNGDCYNPEIGQNHDLSEAASYLAVLSQMSKDKEGSDVPRVFSGEKTGCSRHMMGFTNCCSSMGGWGVSTSLSHCSGEEKALSQKREKKLCHYVGTYCADKGPFGICLRKKSTYCCFGSKLARIFQEQGRPQLGKDWGSAEEPNCEALSAYELQRLDFSKMDLREIYADLLKDVPVKAGKAIPHQLKDQMPKMQDKVHGRETGVQGAL